MLERYGQFLLVLEELRDKPRPLTFLVLGDEPEPGRSGVEGHGQGLWLTSQGEQYQYYYYQGKYVPKDGRPYALRREYNFAQRERGDVEWIIVFYSEQYRRFVLLDRLTFDLRKTLRKYRELDQEELGNLVHQRQRLQGKLDNMDPDQLF
jgi:hypothetical protein